jgi:hypothetical protein
VLGLPQEGHLMLWAMDMISPSDSRLEVLLPMSNVIAIHNMSEQVFVKESLDAMDRKENPATGG